MHQGPEGLLAAELSLETCPPDLQPATLLLREAERQFAAYFREGTFEFSLPLQPTGTSYQQRVWRRLMAIPAGASCTYGDLARRLGSGPRAVAAACRANPLPLIVPCHRVVGSDGIGGYCGQAGGPWLQVKRWLLQHERGSSCFSPY